MSAVVTRKTRRALMVEFRASYDKQSSVISPPSGSGTVRGVAVRDDQVQFFPYRLYRHKQIIARGDNATTNMIGTRLRLDTTPLRFSGYTSDGSYGYRQWSGSGDYFALHPPAIPGLPPTLPKAHALSSEAFFKDYFTKTRSVRGASSLAEALSTVRGLMSPAKALRKEVGNLYNSLRNRLYRSAGVGSAALADVVGGTWLEWQFGIRPLIDDADGYMEALNRLSAGRPYSSIPIRGVGVDSAQPYPSQKGGVVIAQVPNVPGFVIGHNYAITKNQTTVITRGTVRLGPAGEIPPGMLFGLGVEDILPAVWEGIPWSFFFDYFTNVSSIIDAYSVCLSRFGWVNRTVRNSTTQTFSDVVGRPRSSSSEYWTRSTASGGQCSISVTSVSRETLNPADLRPPMRVNLPGFGTKWANVAALATMYRRPREYREFLRLPVR